MRTPGLYVTSLVKWGADPEVRIEKVSASGRSASVTISHDDVMDLLENLAKRLEMDSELRKAVGK